MSDVGNQTAKMVELHRSACLNAVEAADMVQRQGASMIRHFMDQLPGFPEAGKRLFDECMAMQHRCNALLKQSIANGFQTWGGNGKPEGGRGGAGDPDSGS